MNCERGDLAFIIRNDYPENVGRIVRVTGAASDPRLDWSVESQGEPLRGYHHWHGETTAMRADAYDRDLKPIRPNDSAEPHPPVVVPVTEEVN